MPQSSPRNKSSRFDWLLPWLHILGAALVVVLTALFAAVHSPLGREISVGESAGFAWVRSNIIFCFGFAPAYWVPVCWLQIKLMRPSTRAFKLMALSVCFEVASIAFITLLLYFELNTYLPPVLTVLLVSILIQGLISMRSLGLSEFERPAVVALKSFSNAGTFLILLFVIGAAVSLLDPSWRRLSDQIILDSKVEHLLRYGFPPILSGVTSMWLGMGMLAISFGFNCMLHQFNENSDYKRIVYFLIFFSLVASFSAFLLVTLFYAISWQINSLHLKATVWQLFIFLSVSGGLLFSAVFYRIIPIIPRNQRRNLTGIVAITIGSSFLFPITRLIAYRRNKKFTWLLLLISTLGVCVFIGYLLLFGDIFNPWFTVFSYFKGAILAVISVVTAGTVGLMFEQLTSFSASGPHRFRRPAVTLAVAGILGFLPFYTLEKFPEVKAAVLQYNELARVHATFAREVTRVMGLGKWFHIGQRPPQNNSPHPWPQPWKLEKTHPSLLPENFNLLVIVVDALRGDAFHSAGYHRNLTPFLDRWAGEEAVSFRRAYSQGGGSFAAYPFLVAGRSRFDLYGPGLYQQNLYFKIARAEGIRHYMLMQGFGPRDIYPPDFAVTELAIPHAVSDRRSATADEVFEAARKAIHVLPADERFLCFLTLMDVHNDLWKKEGGTDFGDRPRDLYDNNLSYIDNAFSRFIAWLKKEGLYERTVILFTSDHGEQFWEHGASLHGHTVYEEEIRIPLILASGTFQKRFEDVPVIAGDMAPTIADLAGYSVDPPYDDRHMGISLVPLIRGNKKAQYLKRDVVGRASFKRRYFLYHNWEWKLVYFAELDLLQLFNVARDPMEKTNMIQEEPQLAAELERRLLNYLERVEGKTYLPLLSSKK
jgi:glucan phosphoethanolaminetransferase (alkaline phosphatase superfamily)